MITMVDLMKLSISELKEVVDMAQTARDFKGKQIVQKMNIGTEFKLTGNDPNTYVLKKVNRTKVVANRKGTNQQYTIPFAMIIVE
jgi:hypothetical protein